MTAAIITLVVQEIAAAEAAVAANNATPEQVEIAAVARRAKVDAMNAAKPPEGS